MPGILTEERNAHLAKRMPKVTVVTIVLNAVDVIERTVASVTSQDYPNMEYIVIDGGSSDGTLDLIRNYSYGIARMVSEKDGGIYEAMNKGAGMASGEWILFMNGGDVFVASDVITRTFLAASWQGCDVIYGDGIFCHEGRRVVERAPDRVTLHDGNGFSHQSTFMRTALQREYGFDVEERIAADYDLFLRLYKAGKVFKRVNVVVSEFFTGGFSNLPQAQTIRLRHRVYKKHLPRPDLILYLRLARLVAKSAVRALVPTRVWEGIKRLRDRDKVLSEGIR
jgi:putative colanic acid biosynthesis glycosyltransferase